MNRSAKVFYKEVHCGFLNESDDGYEFQYLNEYASNLNNSPVSLTLPLALNKYESKTLFSFFDGLIPEGWLLGIAEENWKINYKDRMGLLLVCCKDCIGAVRIELNDEKL